VIVAVMVGWKEQKYSNVPGVSKVWSKVSPWVRPPLSKDPSRAVTVCWVPSSFVQVTVAPTATSSEAGSKANPLIATAVSADGALQSIPAG
jgi:hypothetical protein